MRRFAASVFVLVCTIIIGCYAGGRTGPAVGSKVPDFEASDQNGVRHSLPSLMGPNGAMLVFIRSADW